MLTVFFLLSLSFRGGKAVTEGVSALASLLTYTGAILRLRVSRSLS